MQNFSINYHTSPLLNCFWKFRLIIYTNFSIVIYFEGILKFSTHLFKCVCKYSNISWLISIWMVSFSYAVLIKDFQSNIVLHWFSYNTFIFFIRHTTEIRTIKGNIIDKQWRLVRMYCVREPLWFHGFIW